MENKLEFTPAQIVEALERCATNRHEACIGCPYDEICCSGPISRLEADAAELIKGLLAQLAGDGEGRVEEIEIATN
ncbi:MAG: hypothetical protein IJX46_07795 [Clostridia bacterium]|nr:hypothetical protein [Clostridia bacterium]